jgi:GAF domain-containing protein
VPDVAGSPIFAGTPARDVMLSAGSRSVASVPVRADDGSLIVVSAHRRKPGPWTEPQRSTVEGVATQTAQLLSR